MCEIKTWDCRPNLRHKTHEMQSNKIQNWKMSDGTSAKVENTEQENSCRNPSHRWHLLLSPRERWLGWVDLVSSRAGDLQQRSSARTLAPRLIIICTTSRLHVSIAFMMGVAPVSDLASSDAPWSMRYSTTLRTPEWAAMCSGVQ